MAATTESRNLRCSAMTCSGECPSGCGTAFASTAPGQKFRMRVAGRHALAYLIHVCSQPGVVLLAMVVSVGPRLDRALHWACGGQPHLPTPTHTSFPPPI